ncbi:MAG: redox-regulated ATPase YchF [Candidatus Shapirobacteria bacterium]
MNVSAGIVGLPNVGKSTLFNALLKKQVADTANYPFCTIEPNKGIVPVPDGRLPVLAKIVNTEKIVPAVVEFIDIAGLVKGAHKGEGLGNKFLANIREVSVIVHVVRFFEDPNIEHVSSKIDPLSDVEIIESELVLADLETLDKQKEPKLNATKEEKIRWVAITKLKEELNKGILAKDVELDEDEKKEIKPLFLLTEKPVIYAANLGEKQLAKKEEILKDFFRGPVIALSNKLEVDLASLTEDEQKEYLAEYNLTEPGLNRLVKIAYDTLGLISFLTAGEKEARAWTISKGTLAQEAAGVIHTDFIKKFIKADVVSFENFVQYGGWVSSRAVGKVRTEGKEYLIKDGEVVDFKIGA